MSRAILTIAVDDCNVEPLGVKEAVAMRLEPIGGRVRVLRVDYQGEEQISMTKEG